MNSKNSKLVMLLVSCVIFLAGCSHLQMNKPLGIDRLDQFSSTKMPEIDFSYLTTDLTDVTMAVEAYNRGQPDVASGLINRAIQSFPSEPELHYTNGLIYLGWSEAGFPQYRDLAEIALGLTIRLDPANTPAAETLANIFLQSQAYDSAVMVLSQAVNQNPESHRLLELLATAAYYDEQYTVAKWAVESIPSMEQISADVYPLIALIYAANGDETVAKDYLAKFSTLNPQSQKNQQTSRAIAEWRMVRQTKVSPTLTLGNEGQQDKNQSDSAQPADSQAELKTVSKRWDVCDQKISQGYNRATTESSSGSVPIMEAHLLKPSKNLVALPSPCLDAPMPRMVFVDVVIISADNLTELSYGQNLLNNLGVVANGGIDYTRTKTTDLPNSTTSILTGSLKLPQAGITYSLNIANSREFHSEIVARPTLVAMDRKPSYFENGESLFVGITGSGSYSSSTLYEIPSGLELSVVPTFIDDDTILLKVDASRALFQDLEQMVGSFAEQLLSERNSVTANVKMDMGQSLILSGLVQRLKQRGSNAVPAGGANIPGFSERVTREATNSVIFILTPRTAYAGRTGEASQTKIFSKEKSKAYEKMLMDQVIASGMQPSEDMATNKALTLVSRDVVFSPRFLPETN